MTPEAKVKKRVKALLDSMGIYHFSPQTGGYGRCASGKFIGIECKAKDNKPTPLQERELQKIRQAGGFSLVINEFNIAELQKSLTSFCK